MLGNLSNGHVAVMEHRLSLGNAYLRQIAQESDVHDPVKQPAKMSRTQVHSLGHFASRNLPAVFLLENLIPSPKSQRVDAQAMRVHGHYL